MEKNEKGEKGENRNAAHYPSSPGHKPLPNKIPQLRRE
jgi:hypothetical protein